MDDETTEHDDFKFLKNVYLQKSPYKINDKFVE
jgi:hypothetical protein